MNVAVIGGGVEGQAAARYWLAQGARVTVRDVNPELSGMPDGVILELGPDYLKKLGSYDLIVRSPGVRPNAIKAKTPVTSGTREFFAHCPARIVGVTGTKGKGTTSSLIAEILRHAGYKVWLGGNIGTPPLDFLHKVEARDVVVLELSSFQLMDLDVSPKVAVCLMITPGHLDWHKNMREYVAAKGNIFWHQQDGDVAVYNPHNEYSTQVAELSRGEHVPYGEPPGAVVKGGSVMIDGEVICSTADVGLVGPHNLENVCAAITATWAMVGRRVAPVRGAVMAFRGLKYRIETLGKLDGVVYVNDGYSSNPAATQAAIRSFAEPKVLILGGYDRSDDMRPLAAELATAGMRRVIVMGAAAARIAATLEAEGVKDFDQVSGGLREAVLAARRAAHDGDVLLLSPGCASFDMYKNFTQRAEDFERLVHEMGVK